MCRFHQRRAPNVGPGQTLWGRNSLCITVVKMSKSPSSRLSQRPISRGAAPAAVDPATAAPAPDLARREMG